jgi:diacylglycerol kinase family enzyme
MDDHGAIEPSVRLGYLPRGTGCDLSRSITVPRDLHAAFDSILSTECRPIDIGRFVYRNHHGRASSRHFHNVLSFGLGGEVDDRVNRTTKALGGLVSFFWATLISIFHYEKKRIHLQVDDHFHKELRIWNVAVANGQYHGGGMWIAPGAHLNDGVFQVTIVGDLSMAEVFSNLYRLYDGKIYEVEKVEKLTGKRIVATSLQKVLLDMDGEQPGHLPIDVEMIPNGLQIISN